MITHKIYEYHSYIRFSEKYDNPVGLDVTRYQCSKIRCNSEEAFERTMKFLKKKCTYYKDHSRRPVFSGVGNFHKIQVDIKNKTLYCSKQIYKKRWNILIGDMV